VRLCPEITFINLDALTYAGKLSNIEVSDLPNYYFAQCDIRNIEEISAIYQQYKPTDCIHFAAESHVDNSIKNP
jgi:dTDP-glucose 4,6-dehydratase